MEKNPNDIVIVSGARTAVAKFGGSLKGVSAIEMGALVVAEAVKRAGIDPAVVDECIIGQVGSWGENGFLARSISLKAGLPNETCAYSVNRQCGSGLQASWRSRPAPPRSSSRAARRTSPSSRTTFPAPAGALVWAISSSRTA